jgi:uncharacterized Ntn-hydrolase superfamily protein
MTRGRKPPIHEKIRLTVLCDKYRQEYMKHLSIPINVVYDKGIDAFLKERITELTVEQQQQIIQEKRREMKALQDEIAERERIVMDSEILMQKRQRQRTETRKDERGKLYQVVLVE